MPPKRKRKAPDVDGPKPEKVAKVQTKKQSEKPVSPAKAAKSADSAKSGLDLKSLITDTTWQGALQEEFDKDYFKEIETKLQQDYAAGRSIFPPTDKIFNAFNLTPLNEVKVVILGQDPYHDDGQAEGLAFSVPDGLAIPPSLKNIFKELTNDVAGFHTPDSGSLVKWAKECVLLLNATLTVEAHTPNSHKSYGWQNFTDQVIKSISEDQPFVVFILWGNFAHKKEKLIDTAKHLVIKDAHPSPLSFNKFKGSKCFSRSNENLKKHGISAIDWCL